MPVRQVGVLECDRRTANGVEVRDMSPKAGTLRRIRRPELDIPESDTLITTLLVCYFANLRCTFRKSHCEVDKFRRSAHDGRV